MATPTIDRASALRKAKEAAARAIRSRLRLPPRLTLSEWADRHRMLSRESSAEPGQWKTSRVPYLREIMDAISGSEYQDITILKSSQSGGTEAINNAVGYYIDQEPSPMLVIQPNVKPMAEAWSKDRLAPMLRDCPRLRGKVKDPRSRDSGNTVLHKVFPGGYITAIGANSPAGLASRPIRIVLADELDRWVASAGTEGDPLSLAEARQMTFRHRKKLVKVTTPGNEGESRGEDEWLKSDQRHYYVPCPHCGHEQPLEWRDSNGKPDVRPGKGDYRLVWDKVEVDGEVQHRPETACYMCRECASLIEESDKPSMLAKGRWVAHNPSSERAGFHISGLLSPWVRWSDVARQWLLKKADAEQRKTFFNTILGLLYVPSGDQVDPERLAHRRESYGAEVPDGVGALTMSIDVQGDRLEVLVVGWGEDEESWLVHFARLYGDPTQGDVWAAAQEILDRQWTHKSDATMRITACGVDSGYLTDQVYAWVRPRQKRGVHALKGVDGLKSPMSRASRANKDKVKVFSFNPVDFKDTLFFRLRRASPGPGYLHFGSEADTGVDDQFFHQFGAEKRTVEYLKGAPKVRYIQLAGRRNEAIDLYCMALVTLRTLNLVKRRNLGKEAAKLSTPVETDNSDEAPLQESAAPMPEPAHPPRFARRGQPRGSYVKGW